MTREGQIKNYAINNCITDDIDDTSYELIVETAEWADSTIIEKAIKWLKENIDLVAMDTVSARSGYHQIVMMQDFEQKFREAMQK